MASFRPALTEAPQRNQPHWDRPVNSEPRPCLFDVGFPLSGLQDRTHTSDLNIRTQHTRSGAPRLRFARSRSPSQIASPRPPRWSTFQPAPGVHFSTGLDKLGWNKTEDRQGDILDRGAVDELVADVDVVVHLAFIV
jgi:hypothetical protein